MFKYTFHQRLFDSLKIIILNMISINYFDNNIVQKRNYTTEHKISYNFISKIPKYTNRSKILTVIL